MAINDLFKSKRKNLKSLAKLRKQGDQIKEKVVKCPDCGADITYQNYEKNHCVCPLCNHYFPMSLRKRIALIADEGTYKELNRKMQTKDPLKFPEYLNKLKENKKKCGTDDAMTVGICKINGISCAVGVLDGQFLMGSMGTVVGEKVTLLAEYARTKKLPLILFSASGGARMQEGIFSLMQMVKTSAAIEKFKEQGGLFISVLTNPTTGGVSASFANLGDIIIAEPNALICFAGPRVIEQTINEKLPTGFQKSEFLLEHGMIDMITTRFEMKNMLYRILKIHQRKK